MIQSNRKVFLAILLAIFTLGLLPVSAYAASPSDVVIGNSYILESGKTLYDDLYILGGSVDLMKGSTINGNVILIGGSLHAAGTIYGDIIALGGTLNLTSTFVLNGNLTTAGGSVNRDQNAQINGQTYAGENAPYFIFPNGIRLPNLSSSYDPVFRVIGFFLRLFLWTLVAMVVAMFIPTYLYRSSQTALSQPLISIGLGLLTIIVVPIILILLAITICLLPVAIIGALALAVAWAFGLIALGSEVGKRISAMFSQNWHPAISAGIGTLALMTVLSGLEAILPCVGWIPKALVGFLGLGAVLLTQFGAKPYPPESNLPAEGSGGALPA